ncbi:hypothetical protein TorRG33x02_297540 [Trema orientale]|uniref:Uncharacterized protein n=1 Tax=Trema orientale TaxID=63057 RepID=A0A2P5C4U4_TREOI|nr:hypothetical protein TorRG33x02_297540 [Trema orientale]
MSRLALCGTKEARAFLFRFLLQPSRFFCTTTQNFWKVVLFNYVF